MNYRLPHSFPNVVYCYSIWMHHVCLKEPIVPEIIHHNLVAWKVLALVWETAHKLMSCKEERGLRPRVLHSTVPPVAYGGHRQHDLKIGIDLATAEDSFEEAVGSSERWSHRLGEPARWKPMAVCHHLPTLFHGQGVSPGRAECEEEVCRMAQLLCCSGQLRVDPNETLLGSRRIKPAVVVEAEPHAINLLQLLLRVRLRRGKPLQAPSKGHRVVGDSERVDRRGKL
mmetsp:Transcript_32429/g.93986  ORF Transcript_32429/g.93986 Transcript_32429/m.93986 type:complete len:227 (+) Transcript_32429:486-1166(+)